MNEKGTSFLDCEHKHMLENGAPPDKFVGQYHLLHTELVRAFFARLSPH